MTQQPPLIRYNVKDRGRKHLGQERNFDIKKLCDAINGGAAQERIKTRGMVGYYGHAPRRLAGMNPAESVVISGKYTEIEPALITTFLKAYSNGDIEHQSEFLETDSGKKAALMYGQKIGGFSSAIDPVGNGYDFYGFDYVLMPNFNNNRGYLLDSANVIFDDIIVAAHSENEAFWQALLAQKDALLDQVTEALNRCQADNEAMIELLATGKPILDDTSFSLPALLSTDRASQLSRDVDAFKNAAHLPRFQDLNANEKADIVDTVELISQLRGR